MNKINLGIIGQNKGFDPLVGYSFVDFLVIQCIYQTLVRIDSQGNISSDLASSWSISDNGKKYLFNLNTNAKFSNGNSVTSKDVAVSLSRHNWKNSKSIIKGYLEDLIVGYKDLKNDEIPVGIKIINDHQLEINLKNPYPAFLYILTMPGFSIVSQNENLRNKNIGSGHLLVDDSFLNSSNSNNSEWHLKPSQNYSGNKVNIKELVIKYISDLDLAKKMLEKQDIDILLGAPFSTAESSTLPNDFNFHFIQSLTYGHFFFNMSNDVNENKDFRRFIGKTINAIAKESTQNNLAFSYQSSFIPNGILEQSCYFKDKFEKYEKNIKGETNLLKKHFRIIVPKCLLPLQFINQMKNKFQKFSMIEIEELELPVYRTRVSSGQYDICFFAYIGNFPDPDGFLDSIRDNNFPGINVKSQTLFDEVSKFKFNNDQATRLKSYGEALQRFENEWTIIPLFQISMPVIRNKKIVIPNTKYRYETELWNFLWEK